MGETESDLPEGAGSWASGGGIAAAGYALGENWEDLRTWMRPADIPIIIIGVILVALYVYRHVRRAWAPVPEA